MAAQIESVIRNVGLEVFGKHPKAPTCKNNEIEGCDVMKSTTRARRRGMDHGDVHQAPNIPRRRCRSQASAGNIVRRR